MNGHLEQSSPKQKWANQLQKHAWTKDQITAAISKGQGFPAENLIYKGNSATRYVHPETAQSVVIDNVTKEVLMLAVRDSSTEVVMENTIYVRLLGEGVQVYRPVPASQMASNVYVIGGYDIYDQDDEEW